MTSIYLGSTSGSYSPGGGVTIDVSEEDYVNCNLFKRYKHKLRTPTEGDIYLYKGSTFLSTFLRYYARLQTGIEYLTSKLEIVDVYVNRFDSSNSPLILVFYFKKEGAQTVDNKYYPYSEISNLIAGLGGITIRGLYTYKEEDGDKQLVEELIQENDKTNKSLTYQLDITDITRGDKYYSEKVSVSRREQIKGSQDNLVEFYRHIHTPNNRQFQKSFVLYKNKVPMKTDDKYFDEIQGQKYISASVYYSGTSKEPLMVEFDSGSNKTHLRRKMSNREKLQWFKPVSSYSYSSKDELFKILEIIEFGIKEKIYVSIEQQQRYEKNTNGSTSLKTVTSDVQPSAITVLPYELKDNSRSSTGYRYYHHLIEPDLSKLSELSAEKEHVSIELFPKISSVDMTLYDIKGQNKEQLYYTSERLSYGGYFQVYFYDHSSTTGQPDTVPLMIHHDGKYYGPEDLNSYFTGWKRVDNIAGSNNTSNIKLQLDKINKQLNKIILTETGGLDHKYGLPDRLKNQLTSFKTERVSVKSEQISNNPTVSPGETCNMITTNSCTGSIYTKYIHSTVNKFQVGAIEYRNKEISIVDENGKAIEVKAGQNQLTVYYLTTDERHKYPLLIGIGKQKNGKSTEQGTVDEFYKLMSTGPGCKWQKEKDSTGLTGGSDNSKLVELLDKINYEVKKVVKIELDKRAGYDLNLSTQVGKYDGFEKINNGHIEVKECQCPGYTELTKFGYKCFRHKLGDSLKNEHNQVGGLAFTLPGAENNGRNSQIKLKNSQSDSGGTSDLYYNKCMGDILVYFYAEDPRPLLLCYQNHTYKPKNKERYFDEWVCVQGLEKCLCENGGVADTNGQNDTLLKALTKVVGFLNTVNLYNHPNGTSTGDQACPTGGTAAPTATQCQPGQTTSSTTCIYTVHTYNGQEVKVKVTCCSVNGKTGSSCYKKLTHTPIGTNGTGGKTVNTGFRLGDVEYCRNGTGGANRQGSIKYYQNGQAGQQNGNLATHKYAPLISVSAYFYNDDTKYKDPLLVVLHFKNGDAGNGRECYKLTKINNGDGLEWQKDPGACKTVLDDNGKLTQYLDQIRYCLKLVVRIQLECQTGYKLMGRKATNKGGQCKFDKPINGEQKQVNVEVCEVACPALTEYKCVKHKLGEALNKVNAALNRIDLDKSRLANGSGGSNGKGYGLPEKCQTQGAGTIRGCKLASTVGNVRVCLTKQQPSGDGKNAYERVVHRTKNGFRIGCITYCGHDITGGITPNGQNGECNGVGSSEGGVACSAQSSSASSDCTIKVANGSNGHNNHKAHVSTNGWNTVAAYYSATDKCKQLPQLIVILKTDKPVENSNPVTVSGDKYGYYVLATQSGVNSGVSSGSGYQYEYQYKWVDVNGKEASGVELDDKTDFTLLNGGVILLEQRVTGTSGSCTYGDEQLKTAIASAIGNKSLQASPGTPGEVNRLQHRDITVKDETNGAESAQGVGTCPCPCKCLKEAGFKMMSHDLTQLVKLNGQFTGKLCSIALITGLKLLIPTSTKVVYKQVKLMDNGGDVRSNGAGSDNIKYHQPKNGNNKIYVFFYDKDPRPLLFCYNKQAYAAISMKDYDEQKWHKNEEAGECKCAQQPPGQCKLVDSLVKVSDFLNPVNLNPVLTGCFKRNYVVHTFNGQEIKIEVKVQYGGKEFCYDRFTHTHAGLENGTGKNGNGFRLGNIHYCEKNSEENSQNTCDGKWEKNCIKLNGASSNNGNNNKCISASDIDDKTTYKASPDVVVFYYRGDKDHHHPLLVALRSPDNGTNGKYTPYFELTAKTKPSDQKKYTKSKNGNELDLNDTKPEGELAQKLDSIQFSTSQKLQIVLSQRPQPAKYSATEGYPENVATLKKFRVDKQKDLTKIADRAVEEATKKAGTTLKPLDPQAIKSSLMHHVLRETQYQGKLCDKNGQPATPPTPSTLSITVKEVDCPEIHSKGGYRCFCHELMSAENIESVGGLRLCLWVDKAGGKASNGKCLPCGTEGGQTGQEITLCNGQATSNGKNEPVQLSYTTCKGDLYVFFYGDDPRPLMLCYDGHAYRPTSMDDYCRQWVRVNNGASGAKNGQGTPVDCLCQDAGGGGQKPKFNTAPLLAALCRVSVFMNPVKLCLSQQAIEDMSHKREDQSDPPEQGKQSKHEYTYLAHAYTPEHIRVLVKARDLRCYRMYTHQPVKHGFRLGVVTYASTPEKEGAAPSPQATCKATKGPGGTCSPATTPSGTTSTDQPFCFAYDYTKQLLTVSTYYYMYDGDHKWPLVVELGFRGQASEFFRLCCKGNGNGAGSAGGNGNGAQGTNTCKSPKGLKWVRMSYTTGSAAKTTADMPNNSCCPDGSNTQNSGSNGQNGDCKPCNDATAAQGTQNNGQSEEDRKKMCQEDAEFAKRAKEIHDAIHSDKTSSSMFLGDRVPMERELTDLVERRAYEIRNQLDIKYDKDDKNLILATASNCWEGWPLDYMVGGGVLGVAGGGGWKIAVAVLGLVVKL